MQLSHTSSLPHRRFAILAVLLFLSAGLFGQIALSPYSRYGLGTLYNSTSGRNYAMGGIGVGTFSASTINRINPASYASLALTTVDLSGFGAFSLQESNTNSAQLGTAGIHNINLGFSNKTGFGIVFGLAPYSSTGYDVVLRDSVLTDTAYAPYTTSYQGEGGINQFYIGAGVRFLKNFRVGANLTIAFGNTSFNWSNNFDEGAYSTVNIEERTSLRGIVPQFGLQYGDTLKIRSTVSRTKLLQEQDKDLVKELDAIDKEEKAFEKEFEKNIAWEKEQQANIMALKAEKDAIEEKVERLMENEASNKKEIGKLQEKGFRLEKKRKKLVRELKARTRELREQRASIKNRREKINARRANLATEIQEIADGKRSATTERKKNYLYRFGATFEPASNLNGEQLLRFNNNSVVDTISILDGGARIPMKMALGFSFVRPSRWTLGLDATLQDWTQFQYFSDVNPLQRSLGFRFGGEIIPDIFGDHFRNRIAFRAGVHYTQTGLTVGSSEITEYGATLGVGLPIGRFNPISRNFSRINIGAGVSRRGQLDSNPLEELNFELRIGVNLGEIWFLRRRID